jgi:flagellar biosynthesis protein FlhG
MPLAWAGEIERDDLADALTRDLGHSRPAEPEAAFMRRLQGWKQGKLATLRA